MISKFDPIFIFQSSLFRDYEVLLSMHFKTSTLRGYKNTVCTLLQLVRGLFWKEIKARKLYSWVFPHFCSLRAFRIKQPQIWSKMAKIGVSHRTFQLLVRFQNKTPIKPKKSCFYCFLVNHCASRKWAPKLLNFLLKSSLKISTVFFEDVCLKEDCFRFGSCNYWGFWDTMIPMQARLWMTF